ncbi:MAG: WHG domain-containing protein [Verrucomicrobia bacterium]|nr:WHG domain-containing protein [Leptolyngbya sp. ES-bin-22]
MTPPQVLLSAHATRNFARSYPARYSSIMHYPMRPSDPQEAEIIQESLHLFQEFLQLYGLNDDALIDVMRMVNAAIYGFITREQLELMTLDRSSDMSYEVMLEALLVAIARSSGS